jgi:hypothetical protein
MLRRWLPFSLPLELPMMGRSDVSALAADAGREDGVVVALGARGVVFVRAGPGK